MEFKLPFLVLHLTIVSLWVTPSSTHKPPTECYTNIMPAVSNMLRGIDITKFSVHTFDHIRAGVLDVSCDANLTWSNAPHLPNSTFALADQVAQITLSERNDLHSPQVSFAHDMIDMRNILLNMSKEPANLIGACSQNKIYNEYLKSHFSDNDSFALLTSQVTVYSIEFKPPSELSLDSRFVDQINMLPDKYEMNPEAYLIFAKSYGTHYIQRASFGATDYWSKPIRNKYATNEKDIEDTLKAEFMIDLGIWAHVNNNVQKPKNFDEICSNVECYNFHGRLYWEDGNFVDSLYEQPGFTEYFLRPLEDLIADDKMKAKVKIASEMYRINSYLEELKRVHQFAEFYFQPSDEDRVAIRQVEDFFKANISSINAEKAIQMIDDLYNKVEGKHVDEQITDYYVTAALKLQFANSICDRSAGLCPSSAIAQEHKQFEALNNEYESSKAGGKNFTREMYHHFEREAHKLTSKYRMYVDLHRGLGASCEKCLK